MTNLSNQLLHHGAIYVIEASNSICTHLGCLCINFLLLVAYLSVTLSVDHTQSIFLLNYAWCGTVPVDNY